MSAPPSPLSRLFARLGQALTRKPPQSPALKTMRKLLVRLARPLSEAELDAAVAGPFASLPLPDDDALSAEERSALLELGANHLVGLEDPFQAARLACFCGTLVEGGAPATLVTTALAERLDLHSQTLCAFLDEVGDDVREVEPYRPDFPDEYRTWQGARLLNAAAMTVFCRDLAGRVAARERPGFVARIARIGDRVQNGVYVDRLFACADRVRFVLIHPAQARGFVLNASAVRNNFHLWILLEDLLYQDGRLHDPRAGQAARPRSRLRFFEPYAWHNWPLALSSEAGSLYGLNSPATLAVIAGELPVILVAPSCENEPWPGAFAVPLHDAHQPQVDVERELTRAEVDQWLERCAAVVGIGAA